MRIRYTKRAELSIERIDDRWRAYRPAAPDLFWTELGEALEILLVSPQRGTVYTRKGDEVRRVLLPKTDYHVYYQLDRDAQTAMLLVVWGGRRERGPKL